MKPQAMIREFFRKAIFPAFAAVLLLAQGAAMALPIYTITDLGDLPGSFDQSVATGINNNGQVVGWSSTGTGYRAFLWDSVAGMTDLGALPPDRDRSYATGINDHGQVVGASDSTETSRRAFLWESGAGMTDLGDLGGVEGALTHTTGINDQGQVVGQSYAATGYRAFLWDSVNGMTDLGDLPGGGDFSIANGINDLGQVVGYSSATTGDRAFLWDSVNGMTDLGDLPGGADSGVAYAINDSGQVVGHSIFASVSSAFLWQEGVGMADLNDLLTGPDGWTLRDATAINSSGQIVGTGTHNGAFRGFLLTPVDAGPETEVIAPGVLAPSILDAVAENKITMQPGLFQSFSNSGFTDGVAGFNPTQETYVLVNGWNGPGSFGSSLKQDVPWVVSMAGELREKSPDANILTWNWTQFADSLAQDGLGDMLGCQADTGSGDCGIVPVNQVYLQDRYLARAFEQLYPVRRAPGFGEFLTSELAAPLGSVSV